MFDDVDRRGILAIDAAARLLRRCRDERDLLATVQAARIALKRPGPRIVSKLEVLARELAAASGTPGPQLSPAELEDVCQLAERLCAPLVPSEHQAATVLRCRIAAEVLEAGWGAMFGLALRVRGDHPARAGDPIPRVRPDLSLLFDSKLTTDVQRLDEFRSDELARLGIAATAGARFAIATSREMFPEPHRELRIAWFDPLRAICYPDQAAGDHDAQIVITRAADDSTPGRFHLFPVAGTVNKDAALALLKAADERGAEIAIAPELTIAHEAIDAVRAWLESAEHVRMIVCGSAHVLTVPEPPAFANRITVLVRRAGGRQVRAFTHDKFNPFDFVHAGHTYYEDIACDAPTITSMIVADWSAAPGQDPLRWSYAVSLCKDLMSDAFKTVFADVRAAMLLAPLMTPKTSSLEADVHGLVGSHQTTSVLANHNTAEAQPAVILHRPMEGGEWTSPRPPPGEPCLIMIRPFRMAVTG